MNPAALHLVSREIPQRATERERFLKIEQGSHKQKKKLFWVRSPSFVDKRVLLGGFLWGMERTHVTFILLMLTKMYPE